MRVLQHYIGTDDPPVGVWWVTELGNLACAYAPDAEAEEKIGRMAMTYRAPEATWEELFNCLERHLPIGSGWESADVFIDPRQYLTMIRSFGTRLAS